MSRKSSSSNKVLQNGRNRKMILEEGVEENSLKRKSPKLKLPPDYFRSVNPFITIVIIVGLFVLVQIMAFFPHVLPDLHLGSFGEFLHRISLDYPLAVRIFFLLCMAVHSVEASIGFYLSRHRHRLNWCATFKWTLSSFVNGYFSLKFLLKPKLK
jgi:hypothetical protein